ncbi:hypothetical protein MVEN_00768800 [Mycena venus]|uniref:Uncharacterized protein n=1 Tax=Mycena venus TaxID=2733690 RepID=A0A8H6YFU1_9AGAR|nr:hypothetical protein MVEN_00768800 [Mycena venus]
MPAAAADVNAEKDLLPDNSTNTSMDEYKSSPLKHTSQVLFRSQSGSPSKAPTRAPESPSKRKPLSIVDVANIFIKMRRTRDRVKPWLIESSSGEEPQSHPGLLEAVTSLVREPLRHTDIFICGEAVNVAQLLRTTRNALMEAAGDMGANALLDEKWNCTIYRSKHRRNETFKVQISYTASATRSDRADPRRPVALDKVKGVPGLMTVLKRIAE